MPPLRLTNKHIDLACELREYGGSDGACARHAGVARQNFFRWMHFGELLRDYLDNDKKLLPKENYRTWMLSAEEMLEKLGRELEQTGGVLSKEHKMYLKLWDRMAKATDAFVVECQQTVDKAKNIDPNWALKGLRWFHPDEYTDPIPTTPATEVSQQPAQHNSIVEAIRKRNDDL